MINYGLKDKVVIITGANNPEGIGATTAYLFAKEGAKVVLVYKKIFRKYDEDKINKNGVDKYYYFNAGDASYVSKKLDEINADYLVLEKDISIEEDVKDIYKEVITKYGRVDILVNNAAVDDENGFDTIEKITQNVIDELISFLKPYSKKEQEKIIKEATKKGWKEFYPPRKETNSNETEYSRI